MRQFCDYLVEDIKDSIRKNINYRKLLKREKYILNARWIGWNSRSSIPISLNMMSLAYNIIDNIICSNRYGVGRYVICINPSVYFSGSSTKLSTIARFLDKGNERVPGMYFISNVFNRYARNINRYWQAYASAKLGVVKVNKVVIVT